MRVFFRELKFYRKSLFIWSIAMIVMIFLSMVKYNTFQGAGQSATNLFAQFPQSIQTIFGLNGFDLTKASGFFGVMFMYIALMATVHAVMLGAGIIAKEQRDKTSEFLFVKPISRAKVITSKLVAGLINMVVLNLVTFISSVYIIQYFTKNSSTTNYVFILMCGLLIMQLIFFFIGTAIASLVDRPKLSGSVATGVLLTTFIMTYLININANFDGLKYLTPFKYFDAKDLLTSGKLDILYVSISFILIVTLIFTTYTTYNHKDLK